MAANHSEAPREPLLTRAGIVTAISVLSALCVHLGAGNVSVWLDSHSTLIEAIILALAPIITAVLARLHVTPILSPQDRNGNILVPVPTDSLAPAPAPAGDAVLEAADAAAVAEPAPTS